jgi:hypothetical protein
MSDLKRASGPGDRAHYDIVFAGLARDCGKTIPNLFTTMDRLTARGIRCAAVIGENGSLDDTRDRIQRGTLSRNVILVDTSRIADRERRLERLAMARDFVREVVASRFSESSFVCVVDLDNVIATPLDPIAIEVAMSRLAIDDTIFAIGASSYPWYYDLLAYKSDTLDFATLEDEIRSRKKNVFEYYAFHRHELFPLQQQITKRREHLCHSAFNGICVYRTAEFVRGTYVEGNTFNSCEHIAFNRSVKGETDRMLLVSIGVQIKSPLDHMFDNPLVFFGRRFMKGAASVLRLRRPTD